ncbi:cytochrome C biogenesis protein [Clostridiales bacterium COT073_COT-073]|nr:cytochrome C biogenesis protein [Clostridiales bacterium COT073_COT-073]
MNQAISIGAVFIGGLLSFFSPCILPVLPVYIGILSDEDKKGKEFKIGSLRIQTIKLIKTILFVLGISVAFLILGFGTSFLGQLLQGKYFYPVVGGIVILLGLHQTGLLKLSFLEREKKLSVKSTPRNQYISAFLLGLLFSFGWTPCIGPIMFSVSALAASGEQGMYAVSLIMIYAAGLMIPFFLISVFSDVLLTKLSGTRKHLPLLKRAGGVLIIFMGILLMSNGLNVITATVQRWFQ